MKKGFFFLIIVFSGIVEAEEKSCTEFYESLAACKPYRCEMKNSAPSLSSPVPLPGGLPEIQGIFEIIGRVGPACHYRETAKINGNETITNCHLNAAALEEFSTTYGLPPVISEKLRKSACTLQDAQGISLDKSQVYTMPSDSEIKSQPIEIKKKPNSNYEWYD